METLSLPGSPRSFGVRGERAGCELAFSIQLRSHSMNHSDCGVTPAADHAHLQFMFHINRFILNDDNRRAGWTSSAEPPLPRGRCGGRKARAQKKKSV